MEYNFASNLGKFLAEVDGLATTLPIIMRTIGESHRKASEEMGEYLQKNGKLQSSKEEVFENDEKRKTETFQLDIEHVQIFEGLRNKGVKFTAASTIIPRSFIVAMISQFDAFLGGLIRVVIYNKPDILNSSEKNLTFSNLLKFNTMDDAREYILEKEIEAVLRESHADQFDWLEKKIGMKLREGLDIWPDFIELTERRNLFVHCDGVVSSQYLMSCAKHKVKISSDCQLNSRLEVDPEYFSSAYKCIYEMSVKLTQVIWRKLLPNEISNADSYLNTICYELLKREDYNLAKRLLNFARSLPRHSDQISRLIFIINSCIAYKWGGNPQKAKDLLTETDWSAANNDFQLAIAVLQDDFNKAQEIMSRIGNEGPIGKSKYRNWPVFKDFRKSHQFLETYKSIFGDPLEIVEVSEDEKLEIVDIEMLSIQEEHSNNSEDL